MGTANVVSELGTRVRMFPSGVEVDLLNPQPVEIGIEDIAHALARATRFNGRTEKPISIAQHCVLGAGLFAGRVQALAYLLHDAHEAYCGDLARPFIMAMTQAARQRVRQQNSWLEAEEWTPWDEIRDRLDAAIVGAFGLPVGAFDDPDIRRIDNLLGSIEGAAGGLLPPLVLAPAVFDYREPWGFEEAERRFLDAFHVLTAEVA